MRLFNILFFVLLLISNVSAGAEKCVPCASGEFNNDEQWEKVAACIDKMTFGNLPINQRGEVRKNFLGITWIGSDIPSATSGVYPEEKLQAFLEAYFGSLGFAASEQKPGWKAEQLCRVIYEDVEGALENVKKAGNQ